MCGRKSVTFDPFTFLSLPLPIDDKRSIEVFFFYLNKQHRPIKVSILIDREEGTVDTLLGYLSEIVKVDPYSILLASVSNNYLSNVIYPWSKLSSVGDVMHGYELIGTPAPWEGHVAGVRKKRENGENGMGLGNGSGLGGLKEPAPKGSIRLKEKKGKKGGDKGVKNKNGKNDENETEKQESPKDISTNKKKQEDPNSEKEDTDSEKKTEKQEIPERPEKTEKNEKVEKIKKEKSPSSDSNSENRTPKAERRKKVFFF